MEIIYTVRVRPGVKLDGLREGGLHLIGALDRAAPVCRTHLLITCATGDHPTDDPHTRGEALDVSTTGFEAWRIVQVRQYLMQILGPNFTVLYECPAKPVDTQLAEIAYINPSATAPHFHLQVKKGTTWPPSAELSEVHA